ncbi:MAG: xanthine dehydrogenase family protein subunit M [Clostridiales bacterium]|nr:xanthine dehydrogenase family protein subunit M [Clostridiales bacterium]
MIPAAFDYERATSVEEAIRLLQSRKGEAKILAGGHSLLPLMKLRLATPAFLVDIGGIQELKGIRREGDDLGVGALTTHSELAKDPVVRETLPLLAEAASLIGDLQVRNRGTVGGNLAGADPASDLPALALALEARLEVQGPDGVREVAAEDFILGPFLTSLADDEVVRKVRFPIPQGSWKGAYVKYEHPASGYAVVGVAAVLSLDEGGAIREARVAITGAADMAYRARGVEAALKGRKPEEAVLREAAEKAAEGASFSGDLFASADYRRHLAKVYTKRALQKALA